MIINVLRVGNFFQNPYISIIKISDTVFTIPYYYYYYLYNIKYI